MNTIYILWLRQLKRYSRSPARIIGSLGQPLLFLVAIGFGFGPIYQQAGGGNYMNYLAPGIISMSILFTALFSGIELIWDKKFGFLKETMVAPVSRLNIMIGRTIGGATVALLQGVIVFLITLLVGFKPGNWAFFPFALLFMFLISLLFTALGTAIASLLEDMQGFQLIMNFLIMPTFFLSGAIFPIDNFPGLIKIVTNVNPFSYGVDGLRGSLTNAFHFGLAHDFMILFVVVSFFLIIGSYLFSRIEI